MNRRLLKCTIALFLTTLLFCSKDANIAGGVDDTGNFLTGFVFDQASIPQSNCEVTLKTVVMTEFGDSIIASWNSLTDSTGEFSFKEVSNGTYIVTAKTNSVRSGILSRIKVSNDSVLTLDTCIVDTHIVIKGRILGLDENEIKSVIVTIPGTEVNSTISPDGFYIISGLPIGSYDLSFCLGNTVNYVPISIKASAKDTIFVKDVVFAGDSSNADNIYSYYDHTMNNTFSVLPKEHQLGFEPSWYLNKDFMSVDYFSVSDDLIFEKIIDSGTVSILIDDFDDGDPFSTIYDLTAGGGGNWFVFNDLTDGGNSIVKPDSVLEKFAKGLLTTDAFNGRSLYAQFILTNTIANPHCDAALNVRTAVDKWTDFNTMSAVSFYIKGTGSLRIAFVTKAVEDTPLNERRHFGKTITLPQTWEKIVIAADEIKPFPGSQQEVDGVTWNDVRDSVSLLMFGIAETPGDSVTFWLDDIYLHGMKRDVFIQ